MCKSACLFIFIHLITFSTCDQVDKKWVEDVVVQDDKSHNVKEIISLVTSPAVQNITTFGSEDTRLTMELLLTNGLHTKRSLILKAIPSTPALHKQVAESGLFNTEIMIHRDALAKMEHVLNEMHDRSEPLWVRALGFKEYEQLLLEDAVEELGYKTGDRWKGLDMDHTVLALKAMAKFHALSAVTDEINNHKLRDQFHQSLLERNYEGLKDFYEVVFNNFAKVIEDTWEPEWASAAKRVREAAPNVKEKLLKLYQKRDTFLNTLNLGSPTVRHTLFKYSISDLYTSDKPLAARFDYFQISFFNSPIHDVQYFMNTSPELEIMTKHKNIVLKIYFESLKDYLKKFGYKGRLPTEEEFQKEVERNNFEGITIAIQILPVIFEAPPTPGSYEESAKENQNSNTTVLNPYGMNSKHYETYMKVLLKRAFDENLL
uniref:Venom kinase 1 n=1 Tax=Platymeris rhadamanthus TaxID=1134088 RepID=A0A6B9L4X9_PLARH|nr:venom kinase 1 [Platymeris rhadamanthus]